MTPAGGTIRRVVGQCLAGGVALALVTVVCVQLGLGLATTAFLYLMAIVLLSLRASFLLSAGLSLAAGGLLAYFFAPPLFSFRIEDLSEEAVPLMAFCHTRAVLTSSAATLQQ